jgi:methionine-rich copper-binding protein CopC
MLLSVLLLFGLALILNVNTSAAATVTTDHTKVTSVSPANNTIIPTSRTVKISYNESIKRGNPWIELKNTQGTSYSTRNSISGNILSITPTTTLRSGFKYNIILHSGSVTNLAGNGVSLYTTSFTVSPLTLAQMKDGRSRAQTFFNTNYRLPNYVSFGSYQMPIAQFQQNIATQGLKINTKIAVTSTSSLDQIMKSASRFSYSSAAHTGAAMERIGGGDCWAMSDYLYTHMTAAGMTARIIQYATSMSSQHRSVQYRQNNTWVNAPYRQYFSTNMFNNTQSYGTVIRG